MAKNPIKPTVNPQPKTTMRGVMPGPGDRQGTAWRPVSGGCCRPRPAGGCTVRGKRRPSTRSTPASALDAEKVRGSPATATRMKPAAVMAIGMPERACTAGHMDLGSCAGPIHGKATRGHAQEHRSTSQTPTRKITSRIDSIMGPIVPRHPIPPAPRHDKRRATPGIHAQGCASGARPELPAQRVSADQIVRPACSSIGPAGVVFCTCMRNSALDLVSLSLPRSSSMACWWSSAPMTRRSL
ncbi:hypothetical protein SAMN05216410_3480 [Sanguibacter gelidistatuariae]|uniref:Uncharacterized protein n=1 Tax=Sanguibacter gelidistatuariae TaxID=1814289 RepID=A0A1G6VM96_9MICO|nr:hypothetical protein SAMN05216410_3480 [Sanguibacter gelidistatuariae]